MSLGVSRNAASALHVRFIYRSFSAPTPSKPDSKAFSKTLLLPKTPFPLWVDPAKLEQLYRRKTCDDLYQWQTQNANGPWFVMHDGPPYANGHLHIGHALNKILKDIISRFRVSIGDRVHYFPGWDCHGLPIENKALQDVKQDPHSLPPSIIRKAARKTAEREMRTQRKEFEKFGIMADWSEMSTYRTLDHQYEMRQLRIFRQMVSKGLIYRDYRPVYFSPSSRSALAEAELVYKDDHISQSIYVTFTLDSAHPDTPGGPDSSKITQIMGKETIRLLVWTTTPWTLSANMGVAVHPDLIYTVVRSRRQSGLLVVAKDRLSALERVLGSSEEVDVIVELPGSGLVGLRYLAIFDTLTRGDPALFNSPNRLRVIPAMHVTSDSGTGLVHCAPAHGAEDYVAFRSRSLLSSGMLCHVDGEGKFSQHITDVIPLGLGGEMLVGTEVLKGGSKAIVKILEGCGALLAVEKIKHRYPYDWKTNEPVIVTATSQWFANLDNIKESALTALEEVTFFPPASRNRLTTFVQSRSEWCISRQRVWGVPIPALYHVPSGTAVLTPSSLSYILRVLDKKGVSYWWDGPVNDFLAPELVAEYGETGWKKGTDTMDVWFDSGTSWSMLARMEGRKHRADICIEGSDQHRGWFQSQLLTAIGAADENVTPTSPYGTLITHGMVLDETGKKMSKSLGNVVSPLVVINGGADKKKEPAYGADVLRLWAATVEYWRDMSIGPAVLAQTAESLRKIRNSARFLLGNIGSTTSSGGAQPGFEKKNLGLVERYVMNELYKLERTALEGYATYNFPRVMVALTNFANITLSSLYFDITKDILYANDVRSIERRVVVDTLKQILQTMTSVLAPVLPYLAEEIYAHCAFEASKRSFFANKWEPLGIEWEDPQAEKDMGSLLTVRSAVLSLLEKARGDKNLKSALEAQVVIGLPSDARGVELVELLRREANFLKTLFIVSDVTLTERLDATPDSPAWGYSGSLPIPDSGTEISLHIRPALLHKCPRCWTFTRRENDDLCARCVGVVRSL